MYNNYTSNWAVHIVGWGWSRIANLKNKEYFRPNIGLIGYLNFFWIKKFLCWVKINVFFENNQLQQFFLGAFYGFLKSQIIEPFRESIDVIIDCTPSKSIPLNQSSKWQPNDQGLLMWFFCSFFNLHLKAIYCFSFI